MEVLRFETELRKRGDAGGLRLRENDRQGVLRFEGKGKKEREEVMRFAGEWERGERRGSGACGRECGFAEGR